MNKKGQSLGIAVLVTILVFIVGMMFVNFIKPEVTRARSGLSCATADDITDGTKMLCLVVDIVIPYFIITVVSVSVGVTTARLLL